MPKPAKGARLGAGPSHERALLRGLAAALIREERIRTTQAQAMRLRPIADRLVTWGKSGTVAHRRRALAVVPDRDMVHKLFDDVAPRFATRAGGYTRVVRLGPRQGDAAPMAIVEFVEGALAEKVTERTSGTTRRRRGRRRREKEAAVSAEETASAAATEAGEEAELASDETEDVVAGSEVPDSEASEEPNPTDRVSEEPEDISNADTKDDGKS